MVDRTELLESTLDALSEGLVLIDQEGRIALWNRAAETITGYSAAETVGRRAPEMLEALVVGGLQQWIHQTNTQLSTQRGMVVQIRHKLNQGVPVFARTLVLRDAMDERIG
ncbi:MAG TPA: PAS domain S-box protein, partial [Terracidiphilus sp.]